MIFNCAHTETVELHKLQPNPKNPNTHPDRQIELLAKIIDYQGQRSPIVVSKLSGFITKGHGRLMALQKLGWEKAAVDFQDYESEAQEYADVVADNKIAELAVHDDAKMVQEIKDLGLEDLELLGLENFEMPIDPDEAQDAIEDEVPENVETRCKPGDLWILGDHRLLCGDSTNIQHVEKLMDGEKADMVFTDPPYGVSYVGKTADALTLEGDTLSTDGLKDLISGALKCLVVVVKPGGGIYISCPLEDGVFLGAWHEAGLKLQTILVWLKNSMVMGRKDYHYKHEPVVYGWLEGAAHKWYGGRDKVSVIECAKPSRNGEHPTMKPVELIEVFLKNSSKQSNSVLDLFGGSGSTLIACEKTNRKCYMMELDPHYCDVIISRWEKYAGKTAQLKDS